MLQCYFRIYLLLWYVCVCVCVLLIHITHNWWDSSDLDLSYISLDRGNETYSIYLHLTICWFILSPFTCS